MAECRSNRSTSEAQAKSPATYAPPGGVRPGASIVNTLLHLLREGNPILLGSLLFLLAFWVFLPALRNGFIDFDDPEYIYENAQVRIGLTWESVQWAFTTFAAGFWHPLTWLSILLDCTLYGLHPAGHHLTSLLLHAANTVLLFEVFRRMTGAAWRSVFVAALFAVHPLHVESVVWAAERKDVLSTLFWLLTMLMYVRHVQRSRVRGQGSAFWSRPGIGCQA